MNKDLLETLKRIQIEILNLLKEVKNCMKKYIGRDQVALLAPFLKVAGILLVVVVVIKLLAMGTMLLMILLCAGVWLYLTRQKTDNDREDGVE